MTTPLGPGREFDLIREIIDQDARIREDAGVTGAAGVVAGPGDDCAIISGKAIALSVDASMEDVHFRRAWLSPGEIGYRAAAAALSDLAPAAARPIGLFVTLAVRQADVPDFALAVMAGISEACVSAGADLLGGDITRSAGPAVIDITVAGEVTRATSRSGARAGDSLWVTGSLGAAASAVLAWKAGTRPDDDAVAAFARPTPRIAEARWLAERGLMTAAIDISDGLAGDAAHLAAASATRILLEAAAIPVADAVRRTAPDDDAALATALGGGEDYELCFTARPDAVERIAAEFAGTFGVRLSRVGRVVEGSGTAIIGPDGRETTVAGAWDHFAER